MIKKTNNYELNERMDEIDKAFQNPPPEAWPQAALTIRIKCPDDYTEIMSMCGMTPTGEMA
jgi:hypothetical protein